MNRDLKLLGALLRKDLRLFWLFALLNASLLVMLQFPAVVALVGALGVFVQFATRVASVLLTFAVFHEDAVLSLKHDWLTRPFPGWVVLLAKCGFVVLAIMAPTVLGGIANSLYQGRSVGEAVLTGLASGAGGQVLIVNLLVMAIAAMTANVRQAVIVILAGIASLAVLGAIYARIAGAGANTGFPGAQWVLGRTLEIVLGLVAVSILCVQYGFRHTRAARVIVGVAVVAAAVFVVSMTWPRVFAAQKFLSDDPAAGVPISLELAKGCFPAHILEASPSAVTVPNIPGSFEDQRAHAGPGAIAFSTQSTPKGVPPGDRLIAGRMQLRYRAAGEVVLTLNPKQSTFPQMPADGGLLAASQDWLLPRSSYDRLAHGHDVETEIDFFLSLLAPKASAEFAADGRRKFYRGIGYCAATFTPSGGVVAVDCFAPGAQAAQLVASLAGAPTSVGSPNGYPDFTPAALDFWGAQRQVMKLRAEGSGTPRVKVTAFAALAHFERRIIVPGVLGGPVSSCPVPTNLKPGT